MLAYRLGARLAGPVAGAVAALSLALSADLYRTALLGSAEPVLIALTLGAVDRHLAGRRDWALVLIALAGLIRPEAWVLLGLYGVYVWLHEPGLRPLAVAAVVLPPVLWLGLDWIGSGDPLHGSSTATSATEGSAANASVPAFEVVRRAADAIILPTLVLAGVGIVAAVRRRDRAALSLAALALGWIAVVAIMAEVGFTGTRRYLAAPAAALCVVAGVGFAWLLDAVPERRTRLAVAGAIGLLALVPALLRAREDGRMLSVARSQAHQRDELRDAVGRAGGRAAVLRHGRPAINPWLQTALAWELDVPLSGVQATWASSKRHPHWVPPALVFRAPSRLAGPRPALPAGVTRRRPSRDRAAGGCCAPGRERRAGATVKADGARRGTPQRRAARGRRRDDRSSCSPSPTTRRSSPSCAASRSGASTGTRASGGRRSTTGPASTSPRCSTASPS